MEEKTVDELIALAEELSSCNTPWHHHFLTPECILNDRKKYVLILEMHHSTGLRPVDGHVTTAGVFTNAVGL